MEGSSRLTPASPPRLVRAVTSHPSPNQSASTSTTQQNDDAIMIDAQSNAVSSSSARKGRSHRARARSVSSNAVTVSQLARSNLAPLRVEQENGLDRGPGTPDYTLSANTPQWRRADLERDRTMSSLGQGLQLISEAESSAGPSSGVVASRTRSGSDASQSSDSSDSHKKKNATLNVYSRPRLSTLRSFFSSFSANNSAANSGNTPNTPRSEHVDLSKDAQEQSQLPLRPQPLVMHPRGRQHLVA